MPESNVTVCIRLRPFATRERPPAVVHISGSSVRIRLDVEQLSGPHVVEERQFVFDQCLVAEVSQFDMFMQLGEPILQSVLEGFNGTLFAYGQTGSGKTYSIMGTESNPGLTPQLIKRLFDVAQADPRQEPATEMRMCMSFLEIYNEEIKDLLDPRPRKKKLYVHSHPKFGAYVPHLTESAASNVPECLRLLDFGAKMRATAQTNMNSTSSRSHSVLTLRVTQVFADGKIRNASVNVCDLAGSERSKKTGAQGQRMREGAAINNSLSVLGQVISKLAAGAERKGVHVPFRQSKLTHLLMDALSGNSVTTMLANVSPAQSESDESLSTLRFAESVKRVKTNPHLTELAPEEPAMLLESFRSEIGVLQEALRADGTLMPKSASLQLTRAIEAGEHLVSSFSKQAGPQWAQAVEQAKALEVVQKQLLEQMRLPIEEVGQLAGVDGGTPYLLNISDDPALSGCLLYFLRAEPEVTAVGQAGPDSIAPNNIVLTGLGITARLCQLRYRPQQPGRLVTVTKLYEDLGRVLVNGRPLQSGFETDLHHGSRLVFGWAYCFRLVISGAFKDATRPPHSKEEFENATQEVLEYSMTTTMSGLGVMRAASQWNSEFVKRSASGADAETVMGQIGELMVEVEEANVLCGELRQAMPRMLPVELDVGLSFTFMAYQQLPNVVVQVWKCQDARQLLADWPAGDFERRLERLRDVHREVTKGDTHARLRWSMRLSRVDWWAWAGQALPDGVLEDGPTGNHPPVVSEDEEDLDEAAVLDMALLSMSP